MAQGDLIRFRQGTRADVDGTAKQSGQLLFATYEDEVQTTSGAESIVQGDIYFDLNNSTRINLANDVDKARTLFSGSTLSTDASGQWNANIDGVHKLYDGLTIALNLSTSYGAYYNTLNVNNLGDKLVWAKKNKRLTDECTSGSEVVLVYRTNVGSYTVPSTTGIGRLTPGATIRDGWVLVASPSKDLILPSAYCDANAQSSVKTADCTNFSLASKSYIFFNNVNANTYNGALTVNINGTGAKPLYINGTASSATNYTLPAGTYILYYDGTNYHARTDGLLPGAGISGRANEATSADKLKTAGTVITDLESNDSKTYTNGGNIEPGVKGILPLTHGGTGTTSFYPGALVQSGSLQYSAASEKGSATLPIYIDSNGVAQTITSYEGNSNSATNLREGRSNDTDIFDWADTAANIHNTGTHQQLTMQRFFESTAANNSAALTNFHSPVIDGHNLILSIDNNLNHTRILNFDIRSRDIYTTAKVNGTWQDWVKLLNSSSELAISNLSGVLPTSKGGTGYGKAGLTTDRVIRSASTGSQMVEAASLYTTGANLGINRTDITNGYVLDVNGSTKLGGSVSHTAGHIYLEGSVPSGSPNNTTQIIFGKAGAEHIALSANTNSFIINPNSTSTAGQIVFRPSAQSYIASGKFAVNASDSGSDTFYVNGTSYFNGHNYHLGGNGRIVGPHGVYTATAASRYNNSALEIRENGLVGNAQSVIGYAPTIGFHWSGRIASTLAFHSDGRFYFRKGNGADRAEIDANLIGYLENRYQYDGTENWSSAPWHKVAHCVMISAYGDATITWLVSNGTSGTYNGILYARLRTGATVGVLEQGNLVWEYAGESINKNDFVFRYTNVSGTSCTAEVWCKMPGRWSGYQFITLDRSNRGDNAISQFGENGSAAPRNHVWIMDDSVDGNASANYTAGTDGFVSSFNNIVRDYNNGNVTRFGYSTSGMTSTSWLAAWDGYILRALNPTNNNIGALTAHRPLGFTSDYQTSAGWGNQTGTGVTTWNDASGGSIEFRKDNPSSGKLSIKVDGRFYGNEGGNPAMLMNDANGYWGMGDPDGTDTVWVRTTNQGIIPYQSGGVMDGHQYLGTSSWYFGQSYITRMYTHQVIVQGTVPSATMNAGEDHPRITFQEGTGTQPVHLMYNDWDTYRASAGLKVVGGSGATPAWFEVEGDLYCRHGIGVSSASSWIDGQRYNQAGWNLTNATTTGSYWPWLRQTNTGSSKWFSFGTLNSSFYWIGSSTSRTDNGYDQGMRFDVGNGCLEGMRWLRVINDGSNNGDDAMVYFQNRTSNDWALKVDITGVNCGVHIVGTGTDMLRVGTNSVLRVDEGIIRCNRKIEIWPNQSNYQEGIRIHPYSNWSDITLGGNDLTAETGISANSWFIGNNDGNNFWISKGSSGAGNSYINSKANKWYINTQTGGEVLNVGGWVGTVGNAGWYSITHAGGWYMTDIKWIRNYNSKPLDINITTNNTYGIGGHRVAAVFRGNSHVSIQLTVNDTLGYGLAANNNGNFYFGKFTNGNIESSSGSSYILYANATFFAPTSSNTVSLGLNGAAWKELWLGNADGAGINYQGTNWKGRVIRFIDTNQDTYGVGVSIGGGGYTAIGSGESADTLWSNLGYSSGAKTMVIGSDGEIQFFPNNNTYDASAKLTMTASRFWAGVNGNTTREAQVGVQSGSGQVYLWSAAATNGDRGLYITAHGTGGGFAIIRANTNNYITILANDVWGAKVRLCNDWIGFYNDRQGGTRYGYVQANADRMYFRKENGANNNIGFDFGAGTSGQPSIYCSGEYISGTNNGLRIKNMILRNDGDSVYFLVASNNNTPGDNWNTLRPFYFKLSTGRVTMANSATISSCLGVNGTNNSYNFYVNGSSYFNGSVIVVTELRLPTTASTNNNAIWIG